MLRSTPHADRRLGRVLAFLTLYEVDQAHHAPAEVLRRLTAGGAGGWPELAASVDSGLLATATRFAEDLVRGAFAHRREIDELIQARAPTWPLGQMSAIDRNVLRLGLYESLFGNATVPLKAAINEAVELAKLFGSETSAKFVNGVLGRAVEVSHASGPVAAGDAGTGAGGGPIAAGGHADQAGTDQEQAVPGQPDR